MRILMVHPHDIYEPLEPWTIRITSLASCLTTLGHEVRLVYHLARSETAPGDMRHRQEFPFEVIPTIRHMGLGLRKARTLTRLARWADIVHIQKALPHAALPSAVAALLNRIPLHYDWDDWEAAIYEEARSRDTAEFRSRISEIDAMLMAERGAKTRAEADAERHPLASSSWDGR